MTRIILLIWGCISRFVRRDFYRKLFAVLGALIVMMVVKDRQDNTIPRTISGVKIKYELPDKTVFRSQPEVYAEVSIEGKSSFVERMVARDLSVFKRISADKGLSPKVNFTVADVRFSDPIHQKIVKVTGIEPKEYTMELDNIETREIPVEPSCDKNELPEGYRLTNTVLPEDQKTVSVTGPAQLVRNVKRITTERIPLDKVTQDFSYTVSLKKPGADLQLSFDKVQVTVMVAGQESREFSGVPVQLLASASVDRKNFSYEVTPAEIKVALEAPSNLVVSLDKGALHPYIDVSAFETPGIYDCTVKCWCDRNDVKIKFLSPEKVSVTVRKRTELADSGKAKQP